MKKINVTGLNEVVYYEKLENGLDVYIYKKEGFNQKRINFVTKYGSMYNEFVPIGEDKMKTFPKGIAHFLEHKNFEMEDGKNAFTEFERYGAYVNAYTTTDHTCYYVTTSDYFYECLNYLLDFVQAPYFTDENVLKEKGIIEQEINMTNDNINRFIHEASLNEVLFTNPRKYSVIGTKEDISAITKEDLYTCYNTFYHPSNMILTISGDIDVDKTINEIKNNQKKKKYNKLDKIVIPTYKEENDVKTEYEKYIKNVSNDKINITYKYVYKDILQDKIQIARRKLFNYIMLQMKFGSLSDFEKELIDKKIIKTYLNYGDSSFDDVNLLIFNADVLNEEKLINAIDENLKNNELKEEEFNLYKKAILTSEVRMYDNPSNISERIYRDIIHYGDFVNDYYDIIKNYTYKEFMNMYNSLDFSKKSILYVTNKED